MEIENFLRRVPEKYACVHTVATPGYYPEMCELTLPNLKAYADRIGADFNLIDKSTFHDFPHFERFQVYEIGKQYKYNLVIDADIIIHAEVPSFITNLELNEVGYLDNIRPSKCFKPNNYLMRDKKDKAMSTALIASTYLTHDVWTPCPYTYAELKRECLLYDQQVNELWIAINLARFGIPIKPIFANHYGIYHIGASNSLNISTVKIEKPEDLIKRKLKLWEMLGG